MAPPILYEAVRVGGLLVIIPSIASALSRSPIKKDLQKYISLPSSHEEVNRFWVFTITLHCLVCDLKLHHVEDYIALQDVVRQCMYLTYTASPSFINVVHHLTMSSYTRNCSSRMCTTMALHPRPFIGTCCIIHDVLPEDRTTNTSQHSATAGKDQQAIHSEHTIATTMNRTESCFNSNTCNNSDNDQVNV